jgi:hypothetical protein
LFVEPITLWTDTQPIHLTLDDALTRATRPAVSTDESEADAEDAEGSDEELDPAVQTATSPIGRLLATVEAELLAIAEGGVEVVRDLSQLRAAAKECRALGLVSCGKALTGLSDELDRFRKSIERNAAAPAEQLLRSAYLARLATECATVCLAVSA